MIVKFEFQNIVSKTVIKVPSYSTFSGIFSELLKLYYPQLEDLEVNNNDIPQLFKALGKKNLKKAILIK